MSGRLFAALALAGALLCASQRAQDPDPRWVSAGADSGFLSRDGQFAVVHLRGVWAVTFFELEPNPAGDRFNAATRYVGRAAGTGRWFCRPIRESERAAVREMMRSGYLVGGPR